MTVHTKFSIFERVNARRALLKGPYGPRTGAAELERIRSAWRAHDTPIIVAGLQQPSASKFMSLIDNPNLNTLNDICNHTYL
jgi:hypothetical protein